MKSSFTPATPQSRHCDSSASRVASGSEALELSVIIVAPMLELKLPSSKTISVSPI